MADGKLDLLGPALAKVGETVYREIGGNPDGIYPYAEIGDNWIQPSLFKDEDSRVRYVDVRELLELRQLITDAWCLEPADKRWTAMHYTINGGKFDATFDYDDLENSDEDYDDRRERILRARYGDKPVHYPPLSGDVMELKPPF